MPRKSKWCKVVRAARACHDRWCSVLFLIAREGMFLSSVGLYAYSFCVRTCAQPRLVEMRDQTVASYVFSFLLDIFPVFSD